MVTRRSQSHMTLDSKHTFWVVRALMFACVLIVFPQAPVSANPLKAFITFFRGVEEAQAAGRLSSGARVLLEQPNASVRQLGRALHAYAMDADRTILSEQTFIGQWYIGSLTISPPQLAVKTQLVIHGLNAVMEAGQRAAVTEVFCNVPDLKFMAGPIEDLDPLVLRELSIVAEKSSMGRSSPRESRITTTAIDRCLALRDYEVLCGIKGLLDVVTSEDATQEAKIKHYKTRLSEQFTHVGLGFAALGCATGDVCGCYDLLKHSYGTSCIP